MRTLHSFLVIAFLTAATLASCNLAESFDPMGEQAELIAAIESAANKQTIDASELPAGTTLTLEDDYFDHYLTQAQEAPGLGYQVSLRVSEGSFAGELTEAFFDSEGNQLLSEGEGRRSKGRKGRCGGRDCFDLVFPVTFTMPDGSSLTLETEDDWATVKAWYEANPEPEERPSLVFPVDIVDEEGNLSTLTSEEDLIAAKEACPNVRGKRNRCFTLAFPHSLTMPDGSVITLESRDDKSLVRDWYNANPSAEDRPSLVFPVDVVFFDESTTTANSQEELEALKASCAAE